MSSRFTNSIISHQWNACRGAQNTIIFCVLSCHQSEHWPGSRLLLRADIEMWQQELMAFCDERMIELTTSRIIGCEGAKSSHGEFHWLLCARSRAQIIRATGKLPNQKLATSWLIMLMTIGPPKHQGETVKREVEIYTNQDKRSLSGKVGRTDVGQHARFLTMYLLKQVLSFVVYSGQWTVADCWAVVQYYSI